MLHVLKFSLFLVFLLKVILIKCVSINSIDSLKEALKNDKNATVAFYTRANLVSTGVLFNEIKLNYVIVSNQSRILEGVQNGEYIAGCVTDNFDPDSFNIIKTGVVSGHAILTLPDLTTEYPHGANANVSRKDFRNAINLAITKVQAQGIDFKLAKEFNKTITDLRTCKLDNPDEFPIPSKINTTGILKDILKDGVLLVGSFGDSTDTDEDADQEFPFHAAYLNAILSEFAKLSGSDRVPYGNITIKRVFAKSSSANLLRSKIHMTEPYFLVDNVYSGSKENCATDQDCVLSDTQNGHEKCSNSLCVAYTRPVSEFFKLSCLTYGTESLFLTKKTIENKKTDSQKTLSSGAVATIVILSLAVVFSILFILFMIWREKRGLPLFS